MLFGFLNSQRTPEQWQEARVEVLMQRYRETDCQGGVSFDAKWMRTERGITVEIARLQSFPPCYQLTLNPKRFFHKP